MPVEDFTTYTEVEEIADLFSVAVNKIDFTDVPRNENSYVYKDFGVGHFDDFEHLITFYLSSDNVGSKGSHLGHGYQNQITSFGNVTGDALMTFMHGSDSPLYRIYCLEKEGGVAGDIDFDDISVDTPYYLIISRNGSTYQALVYDDEARTNLIDTIAIVCVTTVFRYCMAIETRDNNLNTDRHITGYIENLDLQEIAIVPLIMQQMDQFNGGTIL